MEIAIGQGLILEEERDSEAEQRAPTPSEPEAQQPSRAMEIAINYFKIGSRSRAWKSPLITLRLVLGQGLGYHEFETSPMIKLEIN